MHVSTSCKLIGTENIIYLSSFLCLYSSVQLLGDLLFKVSGVSGKMTTDTAHEDDNFGTEHSQKVGFYWIAMHRCGWQVTRNNVTYFVFHLTSIHPPKTHSNLNMTFFSICLILQASIYSHQSY